MTPSPTYLVPGLRTPFCKVDGPLKDFDAIQMSVPVVQAMAKVAKPDLMIWGTVIPSLRWSNLAREVQTFCQTEKYLRRPRDNANAATSKILSSFAEENRIRRTRLCGVALNARP